MARLTDSLTILKRHKDNVDKIIDAKRAGEKIGKEKLLQEMLKISAEPWSDRPLTPKEVEEKQKKQPGSSPYNPGKSPIPSSPDLAHHTGGKHFTEPSMNELIQGLIEGDIPRGTLGDAETEARMIQEYLDKQKQSLKIGGQKLAMNPADIPLGDGLINDAKTNMQNSNKQKYDLMYQEGFINRKQYEKQMKRTFGKDYEQYLVD